MVRKSVSRRRTPALAAPDRALAHPIAVNPDSGHDATGPGDLAHQLERERLVTAIAQRIRASLDLNTILARTAEEIRLFLQTDRVLIYRFAPDWRGTVVVEALTPPCPSILGNTFQDPCFIDHIEAYRQGRIHTVTDVATANLPTCYAELLASMQVQANLVIPIVAEQQLWGLLIAHHCDRPWHWQPAMVALLQQLATQVGIAAQQAELHSQLNACNIQLELQVQERTAKLQQALEFEALVRRITEKMRDSLDESQILQTAAQELADGLHSDRCKVELYDPTHTRATIAYEHTTAEPLCQGIVRTIATSELYAQLLQKQPLQFTTIDPNESPNAKNITRLACPIFDDQGILGNLWLVRPCNQVFDPAEVACVQLVASQCAIAIRQARLYETAQHQVTALEKLIRLKDDFLTGISHELQTPLSSINLATQTLERLLQNPTTANPAVLQRALRILRSEYQRESRLVNNLLTISYADGGELLTPISLVLQTWLPAQAASFHDRMQQRQQDLQVAIAPDLPPLHCDAVYLERMLQELLTNAYKYTPAGGAIVLTAETNAEGIAIHLSNAGVEIPPADQDHIFERFYRIPSHDVWEAGGAGLGLTVVQKLAERIGIVVKVASANQQTQFTLQFSQADALAA